MTHFVDTSGLLSILNADDRFHPEASSAWTGRVAQDAPMALRQRDLSLVDCTSFELMRRLGLHAVFTFDQHFARQGFTCLP